MTQIDKTQLKGDGNPLHFHRADNEIADPLIAHKASHQDGGADELDVTGLSGLLATPQTPAAHYQAAESINSGTLDGGRLPGMSTTKRSGVPPVATATGKVLKDSGLFEALSASDIASGELAGARLPAPTTVARGGVILDGNAAHFLNGAGGCTTPASGGSGGGVFIVTATTGAAFASFVASNGAGTYILTKKIVVSASFTISTSNVLIVGQCSYRDGSAIDIGGVFDITMTSGTAISIDGECIRFENCYFRISDSSSSTTLVSYNGGTTWRTNDNHSMDNCAFLVGTGTGLYLHAAYFTHFRDIRIVGPGDTGSAVGIDFYRSGGPAYFDNLIIELVRVGIKFRSGGLYIADSYFFVVYDGIEVINRGDASAPADLICTNLVIDFVRGVGVTCQNTEILDRMRLENCHVYCDGTGAYNTCLILQNAKNVAIHSGYYQPSNTAVSAGAIHGTGGIDGLTVSHADIYHPAGAPGIYIAGSGNKNVMVTNNRVRGSSSQSIGVTASTITIRHNQVSAAVAYVGSPADVGDNIALS